MRIHLLIWYTVLIASLSACGQHQDPSVPDFEGTEAQELAQAVATSKLQKIEKIVRANPELLNVASPEYGYNVLGLSIKLERYPAFEKLLELGADPNYLNPQTKQSVLIEAIRPYGNQMQWRITHRYVRALLAQGADPNYAVEADFVDANGRRVRAVSPLSKAATQDLETVKMLIRYGADPHRKIGDQQFSGFSRAVRRGKYDIIHYYIDSLRVDVHQAMGTVIRKPSDERVTYYIQDYAVNKFTKAKVLDDTVELERLKQRNAGIEAANEERWALIQKLEGMGVDFKNYDYQLP
ncbi:MAG: ankyrin repeat domain-containing protein [Bacteroidota bacterium]